MSFPSHRHVFVATTEFAMGGAHSHSISGEEKDNRYILTLYSMLLFRVFGTAQKPADFAVSVIDDHEDIYTVRVCSRGQTVDLSAEKNSFPDDHIVAQLRLLI